MTRPLPPWDPAVDDMFVCVGIRRASSAMTTLVLAPRAASAIAFDAGQHVTIEFTVDGTPVNRCYTLSSPPTRPERLEITAGRRAGGMLSPRFGDSVTVGSQVRVGSPQGTFTMRAHPADAYLLLTAGSGITPALAMLRELYDLGRDVDVALVHAQRRPDEIPCRDELELIASGLLHVRLHFVCSAAASAPTGIIAGRVDAALVARLVPDAGRRETFICGPDAFRQAMIEVAAAGGVAHNRVHQETFAFTDAGVPTTDISDSPTPEAAPSPCFSVQFRNLGTTIACPPGTTVLAAAAAAGLVVPSSCGEGLCGTCKHTLLAGEVDMRHAGGIRPREIANGKFLLCCSRPLTDLVVSM